ncbi:LysR family transcriptional regulator [Oscillospiraceae bacterium 52-8]|nr:LysR family transcriptional regulator [Bittarella massiliensis (ex Durand et al. 2017)]
MHLRYALEVEKTGSMTQAADNLYTTQPNLSKAVKKLEADLGMAIFKRTPKGLLPTKQGADFLERARSILEQVDQLEARYRPGETERISFSVAVPRASYITHAFTKFVHSLGSTGGMEIDFKETGSLDAVGCVAGRDYRLGILRTPPEQEQYFLRLLYERELQHHLLWEFEPLLLLSQDHPLARQETIYERDLASSILLEHGDLSHPTAVRSAGRDGEPLPARRIALYERGSQFDLLQAVPSSYIWASPVPQDVLSRCRLVQRRCHRKSERYKDLIVYAKGYRFSELDRAFIAKLTATIRELGETEYH